MPEPSSITVNVNVQLSVSKHSAETCMRIVELWLNGGKNRVLVPRKNTQNGEIFFELQEMDEQFNPAKHIFDTISKYREGEVTARSGEQ